MTIILYTFTKRKNSTKIPTGGVSYTGTLKDNTSVVNPSIVFEFSSVPQYNYCYIQDFGRYYWITDTTHVSNNIWILTMHVDVLASYKNEIGSSAKYVLRAASEKDGDITDLKYPIKAASTHNTITQNTGHTLNNGVYMVQAISPNSSTIHNLGVTTTFLLNNSEMDTLLNAIVSSVGNPYYDSITDPDIKNFAITVSNPLQYIVKCIFYPIEIDTSVLLRFPMKLGNIVVGNFAMVPTYILRDLYQFTFTDHPQNIRGNYTKWEPFTQRSLTWLPVGELHIPSALICEYQGVTVETDIDLTSGLGELKIMPPTQSVDVAGTATVLYRTNFSFGFDVPLAQLVSRDSAKIVSGSFNLFNAGISLVTGNIGGAISSGLSAAGDFLTANVPQMQNYLAGSGTRMIDATMRLTEIFYEIASDNNLEMGYPLCKTRVISSLSGYVLCADGDVETDGTEPEISEIESYLTGGFFYE